jgi:hypothetical protein
MIEFPLIHAFGLGSLLTEQDDPALWEAALGLHWSPPEDPNCMVDALRFDIGRRLETGEQPVGEQNELHAKMRGLVDIQEWCFERMDKRQLQVKPCPSSTPPVSVLPGLGLSGLMSGFGSSSSIIPTQVIFIYLGISRPSRGVEQAVVYSGSSAPGLGEGVAYLWLRQEKAGWQSTDQRLAWWIT